MSNAYGYKLRHRLGYEDEGNLQGLQGLPEELVLQIGNNDSAKEMWEAVKSLSSKERFQGLRQGLLLLER
ncbi:hypothetical protein HanRHA438_Chr02g0093521 [Helianthus annuus]|nr:hypothetical protein HanRHA438_Chr02g0093521 [Helianthus annuus]